MYIFDEATSNIDVESENDIMEEIRALAKTKTVLLISHRLANVVDADRIYVLDKGQVAESGTHQELLGRGGAYRRLCADCIYVLDKGQVAESGTHQELLERGGAYRRLWDAQAALEHYGEETIP